MFTIAENLSKILEVPFEPDPRLKDEALMKRPKDAIWGDVYQAKGTEAARIVNTGRKRPEHSAYMKEVFAKGIRTKPKGLTNLGNKFSEETKKLIGTKSGSTRRGKKRGGYNIINRMVSECPHCHKSISGAGNIKRHIETKHG